MIDLTGLEDVIKDASKDDGEVATLAAQRIMDALKPFNGKTIGKDAVAELNKDLSELAQMLYDNQRLAAFQALNQFLTKLFGGCGGGGGGCGDGCCGGGGGDDCCGGGDCGD